MFPGNQAADAGTDPDHVTAVKHQRSQRKTLPVPSLRRNQPQPVAEMKPPLGTDRQSGPGGFQHLADSNAENARAVGIDQRPQLSPTEKSGRRPPGRRRPEQLPRLLRRSRIPGGIKQHPVGTNRFPDILRSAQPPLDLQRGNAETAKLRQKLHRLQILRREQKSMPVTCLVIPAARLFALAAVAAPAAECGGEQAASGKAAAERPVHEHLQFHRRTFRDPPQLLQRHLPFENHPADSERGGSGDPGGVVNAHLRGGVQRQLRKVFPTELHHRRILHDQRIGLESRELGEKLRRLIQLLLPEQRIEGEVDPAIAAMRILKQFSELLRRKIRGALPGVELRQSAVDRIGPRVERGEGGFQISGRSEQLRRGCVFLHAAKTPLREFR